MYFEDTIDGQHNK